MLYLRDFYSTSSSSCDSTKSILILKISSYIVLIAIFIAIFSSMSKEDDQFKYIYYMSKIITIKSIILNNHYSEILEGFTNSGKPITLPTTYRNLLKLVKNKNGCISNYKPCGILDTYGNVLCIDEFLECPVNRMKVDNINKASFYSSQNYRSVSLSETSYNYKFFYSNQFTEGNAISIIIKTKDEPKYITSSNFILDSEAFKEVFGDQEFLDKIADIFGLKDDEKENDDDEVDKIIKIFQVIKDDVDEIDSLDIVLKGAKLLYTILTYQYNKQVEKFNNYVKEQIDILDEDNIDTFFEHIGDNFYAKNYIGFKSVEDINKFMIFDYNIYKKKFPNFKGATGALACFVILLVFLLPFFYGLYSGKKSFIFSKYSVIMESIIYYGFALGYFIYALYTYINVNKSKKLDELKSIKSDEFINSMINDFVSECQKSALLISTLCIISLSIILHVISMILYCSLNNSDY